MLLAMIADAAHVLAWQNTKDGRKGRNPPQSIVALIRGDAGKNKVQMGGGFDSPEDFRAWNAAIARRGANGGSG